MTEAVTRAEAVTPAEATAAEAQRKIVNRLKRAQGQLAAVIGAVERGGDCRAVVTQLSAVSGAIDRAGFAIIASAMRDCLADPVAGDHAEPTAKLTVDELEKLFLSLA
ncbi:metal-sensitive transcriptional regulator [Glaciibacter psychrotolerans]|uniref:DNA-binding FrmR family transcriptional regulator n=1 Tax=Glaciibacter psychrotolerans TaxID=670054 RepID=A0A7Z0EEV1_9MICO|nr:metal-sensitive transcriptional regulator [Leifsonia psychrotolerans]NYJ19930.1 DNA-binding FrmR family transcriptional regulator [Leifsonia psychrotolerans]